MTIPARRAHETVRAYYARLGAIRDGIRAYLPTLRDQAVEDGRAAGMTVAAIAERMGVTVGWLYQPRGETVGEYDESLLPARRAHESALDYYARLRSIRDSIRDLMPQLVLEAVDEADAEGGISRTKLAAEMGITESYLYKKLREHQQDEG